MSGESCHSQVTGRLSQTPGHMAILVQEGTNVISLQQAWVVFSALVVKS